MGLAPARPARLTKNRPSSILCARSLLCGSFPAGRYTQRMNPNLDQLKPYPFERLAELKSGLASPVAGHIALSIGEPRHPTPEVIKNALTDSLSELSQYPTTRGTPELRQAITRWLVRRFALPAQCLDAETNVLPVGGTREALFSLAQTVVSPHSDALVLMPNPFYQIYEGAALLAGAKPWYLSCLEQNNYLPDFENVPESVWRRCQLLYICSPGNPTGAVLRHDQLVEIIRLSERFGFVVAADECYCEIYAEQCQPPVGLLQVAAACGREEFNNLLVFHSLSKRSNAPGLRSGFVAGDAKLIRSFLLYRTYHGCALSPVVQRASIAAWDDETHVVENRAAYSRKFDVVVEILRPVMDVRRPDASFYLWPRTPFADTEFARRLFEAQNVTVLPGSFLSRRHDGIDPGQNRIRIALVAGEQECHDGAHRIRRFMEANA